MYRYVSLATHPQRLLRVTKIHNKLSMSRLMLKSDIDPCLLRNLCNRFKCFFYRVWEVHLADGRFRPDPSPYFTTKIYEMEHANAIGESVRMQAHMLCERLLTTHDVRHASVQDRHANANVQTGRLVINIQTGRVDTNQEDSYC